MHDFLIVFMQTVFSLSLTPFFSSLRFCSAGPFTVFAPTNDAFDALPDGALDYLVSLFYYRKA